MTTWLLVGLVALALWFVADGVRNRCAYDTTRDYCYPFEPEERFTCRIDGGHLQIAGQSLADLAGHSLLLRVHIETGFAGRVRDPHVIISTEEGAEIRQYFERGARGVRFVDISVLAGGGKTRVSGAHCRCAADAELLAFRNVDLIGPILIIAPHPDDAELAAFGLYSAYPERTTIATVSAGETLRSLKKQYVPALDSGLAEAMRRKGLTRALDAVSAPHWGGLPPEAVIELGYFNETLCAMERSPASVVPNPLDPALRPAYFRRFNRLSLASDAAGENRWETLVSDLAEVVGSLRPMTVVTPHPELDPHPDHGAATRALDAALAVASHAPANFLHYTTHIRGTSEHPFGPPHCTAGPPPNFNSGVTPLGFFSLPVPLDVQLNKVSAMEAMHDLRSEARLEKRVKKWAQRVIAWRRWPEYGEHIYFRTAIKANEIFFVRKSR